MRVSPAGRDKIFLLFRMMTVVMVMEAEMVRMVNSATTRIGIRRVTKNVRIDITA